MILFTLKRQYISLYSEVGVYFSRFRYFWLTSYFRFKVAFARVHLSPVRVRFFKFSFFFVYEKYRFFSIRPSTRCQSEKGNFSHNRNSILLYRTKLPAIKKMLILVHIWTVCKNSGAFTGKYKPDLYMNCLSQRWVQT